MFTNHAYDDLVHNKEIEVCSSLDFKVGNILHYKDKVINTFVHSGWLLNETKLRVVDVII